MKELQYKDMHFILSESGKETEYGFMTMPLMGEVSKFTLSHKADTENHSIVSDVFFIKETVNTEFFEKNKKYRLNDFKRVIDGTLDLTFGGNASNNGEIKIIGNDDLKTSTVEVCFIEISDDQFNLWNDAVEENSPSKDDWFAIENRFPNTGHCRLSYFGNENPDMSSFATILAYTPTKIFKTLWDGIESKNIDKFYTNFQFQVYTSKSQHIGWGKNEKYVYFIPPSSAGYGSKEKFSFESSSTVGGKLTEVYFSKKYE
jgi:hypothetical protein